MGERGRGEEGSVEGGGDGGGEWLDGDRECGGAKVKGDV